MLQRFIFSAILAVASILALHTGAQAAVLSVNVQEEQVAPGETAVVDVRLDSEGEVINAAEVVLEYPADLLEVAEVTRGGSFLTLWIQEPTVDAKAGRISLTAGIPNGSFVDDGLVFRTTFRATNVGSAAFTILQEESRVLLNDGLGTPAALRVLPGALTVSSTSPYTLALVSASHPSEEVWYQQATVVVAWEPRENASYSYLLTTNPIEEPDDQPDAPVGMVTFADLPDGIYTFVLKEKLGSNRWEVVAKRKFRIDRTPPLLSLQGISQDVVPGRYALVFSATDSMSGILRYDVVEGERVSTDVSNPYVLTDQKQKNPIALRVYDRAGNVASATLPARSQTSSVRTLIVLAGALGVLLLILLFALFRMRAKNTNS